MSNQDVMNVLKSLTLEDIIKLVINDEKKNGVNEDKQEIIESSKEIYNIEELIEKYPFFTRYNIVKIIKIVHNATAIHVTQFFNIEILFE